MNNGGRRDIHFVATSDERHAKREPHDQKHVLEEVMTLLNSIGFVIIRPISTAWHNCHDPYCWLPFKARRVKWLIPS
ncbi:hypothetical protein AMATHDRAFT_62904 [Amanita thiersii Skay4041]|uniref:Uncharacterized protein n=1 Tax=Amanita thiersii Skay4041 TaxID=703135 RepID=A0A2A9NPI0_9AGAR|nr:hypothetical protein AMATHDRAFT_62904 [Amanita thiersii Skay4041]